MPEPPRRPCAGHCGRLVERGHCAACASKGKGPQGRKSAYQRGYNGPWKKYSAAWLRKHPFCVDPQKKHKDVLVAASEVDHIIPHKGDWKLFWDPANHQGLCKPCHSRKTASEGGFGRDY